MPTPHAPGTGALMSPYSHPADTVAADLGTDTSRGLSPQTAADRLSADGPNELPSKPPVPAWRRFLSQFNDPLVYLLLAAITISTAAWILEGAEGAPVDSIVILAVVTLNAVLGFVQENKAADAVAALSAMTEATSTVLRDGSLLVVPSSELVVGDVLVLGEGDQVGADARLLSAAALRVVESSLTGEADAVVKTPEAVGADTDLADRTCMVYRGTSVAQGTGRAVVVATGADTQMGAIARMLDSVEEEDTPLQKEIHAVSKMLGIVVVVIAVVVVGTLLLLAADRTPDTIVHSLLLGVSLAVAAVPEGLPAILSVVLALGVQRMALHQAVVKKLTSVETLGSASVICSDKTGTLTKSEMTIQEVVTASGSMVVTGIGYAPEGDVAPDADRDGRPDVEPLSDALRDEVTVVLSGGAMASDAQLSQEDGVWRVLGDPTEGAFLVAERKLGTEGSRQGRFTRIGEVPFTSERKLMSVVVTCCSSPPPPPTTPIRGVPGTWPPSTPRGWWRPPCAWSSWASPCASSRSPRAWCAPRSSASTGSTGTRPRPTPSTRAWQAPSWPRTSPSALCGPWSGPPTSISTPWWCAPAPRPPTPWWPERAERPALRSAPGTEQVPVCSATSCTEQALASVNPVSRAGGRQQGERPRHQGVFAGQDRLARAP